MNYCHTHWPGEKRREEKKRKCFCLFQVCLQLHINEPDEQHFDVLKTQGPTPLDRQIIIGIVSTELIRHPEVDVEVRGVNQGQVLDAFKTATVTTVDIYAGAVSWLKSSVLVSFLFSPTAASENSLHNSSTSISGCKLISPPTKTTQLSCFVS